MERFGYKIVSQDRNCWILERDGHPIVISQTMILVPLDMLESILGPSGMDEETFKRLVAEVESSSQPSAQIN